MSSEARSRLVRVCFVVAALSGAWAVVIAVTGGFVVDWSAFRLSSRSPRNSTIVAALSAAVAFIAASPAARRRALHFVWSGAARAADRSLEAINAIPARWAAVFAAATAVGIVIVGLAAGSHVAGAGDSYAYASQADLWAAGRLRVDQPLMSELSWPFARQALSPLGYRPAPNGPAIVPVYAAGLPMVMAIFSRVAGRGAVFYVVPLMGGLAIWATYLMGRRLAGPAVGLAGTTLLATSPAFLYQLVQPMSDVPVTAWWAVTLALVQIDSAAASLVAGAAAGLAILTRPNLSPLAVVVAVFLVWRARRTRSFLPPVVFVAGLLPGSLVAAALNGYWYGSPFRNGYGSFDELYQLGNFVPNLISYPRWLIESETPIVALGIAAPLLLSRWRQSEAAGYSRATAVMWLAFILTVWASYLFYGAFDAWWYLRFVLPAFPPLMVLTGVAIVWASARLAGRGRMLATAIVVLALGWRGLRYAKDHATFDLRDGEQKYAAVGRYVAARLPGRAVCVSVQHSGSIRYYSGRLTVRFDWIDSKSLDSALDDLRRLGYQPYFVLDEEEEPQFKTRFANGSAVGALDWPPVARLQRTPSVLIYDPSQRRTDTAITDTIPMGFGR